MKKENEIKARARAQGIDKLKDFDFKIGTPEESFLTAEVKGLDQSKEIAKKNLEQIEWIKAMYNKRIKEIEDA